METLRLGRNDVCRCGSGKKYKKCCLAKQFRTEPAMASPTRRVSAGPRTSSQQSSDGIPEYVVVKGKGHTHRSKLRPGDECELKDGSWAIYRPDLVDGGSVLVKDKGWIPERELKPGDQYDYNGVWVTFQPERVIGTTEEHPFYVWGKGWTPLRDIRPGDLLRTEDGWVPVNSIENTGRVETVYNLQVEEYHTYFVGAPEWGFAVWAHNTCYSSPELARAGRALRRGETNEVIVRNANEAREVFFREFRSGHGVPSYRDTTGWSKAQVDVHGKAGTHHWDTVFDRTSALDNMKGRQVLKGHYDDGKLHNYMPHLQIHTLDGRVVRILFGG